MEGEKEILEKWLDNNWDKYMDDKKAIEYDLPLRFVPLNECKPGYHAHHIDRDHVIFIPRELHIRIHHDLESGIGMRVINQMSTRYLCYPLRGENLLG